MLVETQKGPVIRPVGPIEFRGIMKQAIPIFDEFGEYNEHGLAIVEKHGKYGVVDKSPAVVLNPMFEDVDFTANGIIVAREELEYSLYSPAGMKLTEETFRSKVAAMNYAKNY